MIFKFYFQAESESDPAGIYIECNANSMKEFSDLLASRGAGVSMKIKVLGIENNPIKNVGLFLTEASSLGTAENLVQNSLESQKNEILSFEENSGVFIKRAGEDFSEKKFTTGSGNNLNSRLLLSEENEEFVNGSEILFVLRFEKSNNHENSRFFVNLEAGGDYT